MSKAEQEMSTGRDEGEVRKHYTCWEGEVSVFGNGRVRSGTELDQMEISWVWPGQVGCSAGRFGYVVCTCYFPNWFQSLLDYLLPSFFPSLPYFFYSFPQNADDAPTSLSF